ncbi:hypothetical protein D6745_02390 [Candidatus Woesearchaeota archaeon]|nr:MAG: hypothetical protein D6745_02390 [Candidatus Woesearchaeota archaeon]
MAENITKLVENYILEHASIKDCLKNKLINYSALSRKISKELGVKPKNFDAVLVALRRLSNKLEKKSVSQRRTMDIVKRSSFEIRNKVAVLVIEKGIIPDSVFKLQKEIRKTSGTLQIIEGASAITIITDEATYKTVRDAFKNRIIKTSLDLVAIIIKSPEDLEETPGVISYFYSLLGEREINIVETISCWTDTIILIEKKNLDKTLKVIRL